MEINPASNMTFTERRALAQAQMFGLPAGIKTLRAGGTLGSATLAAVGEATQPFQWGTVMSLGFDPYGETSTGFAFGGHKGWTYLGANFEKTGKTFTDMYKVARNKGLREAVGSAPFKYAGYQWAKTGATGAMRYVPRLPVVGSMMSVAWTGYAAYEGYQQGGLAGAGKAVAREALNMSLFHLGMRAIGPAWPVLLTQTASAGYAFSQLQKDYQARYKHLPIGTAGAMDAFSTQAASTMRQRSLMAIQRSHLNARSALGAEASYMHSSSYRGL